MIKLIWKQYNWYVVLVMRFKNFAWKLPKLKIVKIESCLDWKVAKIESWHNPFLSVIIKYVNDTGAWKLKMILEHESCQSWKLPKLEVDKIKNS